MEGRNIANGPKNLKLTLRIALSVPDPSRGREAEGCGESTLIISTEQDANMEWSSALAATNWSRFWRDLADTCLDIEELGAGRLVTFVKGLQDATNS